MSSKQGSRRSRAKKPRVVKGMPSVELTREECEQIIMQARVKAGWISEADLAPPAAAEEPAEAEAQA